MIWMWTYMWCAAGMVIVNVSINTVTGEENDAQTIVVNAVLWPLVCLIFLGAIIGNWLKRRLEMKADKAATKSTS